MQMRGKIRKWRYLFLLIVSFSGVAFITQVPNYPSKSIGIFSNPAWAAKIGYYSDLIGLAGLGKNFKK